MKIKLIINCFFLILISSHGFSAEVLNKRVLLNAESFGFGPSAAIAEIFPHLESSFSHLSYIGTGHSLDLQRKLPYDEIFDYSADTYIERKEKFMSIAKNFDVFITACDFETAVFAKSLGLTLIIYDPLTWYWKEIPAIVADADLYIAQDFFGVKERINNEPDFFKNSVIVPAIISEINLIPAKHHLLVNMGGLCNPYTCQKDLEAFANVIFEAIHRNVEPMYDTTTYTSSKFIVDVAKAICNAKTLQPQEVQKSLQESELAIMTSGLGNIYEASSLQKKVIWLPPANDSQGQQIQILQEHDMVDYRIDWSDIFVDEKPINYFETQEIVMQQIAHYMKRLSVEPAAKEKFQLLLQENYKKAQSKEMPKLAKLTHLFKTNGAKAAAEAILKVLSQKTVQDPNIQ